MFLDLIALEIQFKEWNEMVRYDIRYSQIRRSRRLLILLLLLLLLLSICELKFSKTCKTLGEEFWF